LRGFRFRQDIVKALKQLKAQRPGKPLNGMSAQKIADKLEALLATKEFKRPRKYESAVWPAGRYEKGHPLDGAFEILFRTSAFMVNSAHVFQSQDSLLCQHTLHSETLY